MSDFTISIPNSELKKFNKDINKYGRKAIAGVKSQVAKSAINIQRFAVLNIRSSGLRDVRKSYKYDAALASSILIRKVLKGLGAEVFTKKFYAIFREEGTKPHKITAKHAPWLVFKVPTAMSIAGRKTKANTWVKTKSVNHPGTKAAPFMEPAALRENPNLTKQLRLILSKTK